ncbi:MAG TPA: CRISPR system precrRNA processing endoribonuclease RAMP protein Cas6 [Thermoanaerobaculia bacterium]
MAETPDTPLPRIPYLRLRTTLRAEEPAVLPAYKGSTLRGAFGHALRRLVCVMGPEQPCESCLARRTCHHARLFETFVEGEPPPFLQGIPTAPRPYVFEPITEACDLAPGDPLEFDLLLLGQAIELLPYALLAMDRMAAGGLGRGRARFTLDRVLVLTPDGAWETLHEQGRLRSHATPSPCLPPSGGLTGSRALLRFLTPARLVLHDRLLETVTFSDLTFLMLRRALELAHFHVPGAHPGWTLRPLLDRAREIRIANADLHWRDWQRYSNRQRAPMTLGGFVGALEIEGDLAPFVPLLRTAEVVHVGKGATFGLGKVELAPAAL